MTDWDRYPDLLRALADDIERRKVKKPKKKPQLKLEMCQYVRSTPYGHVYTKCSGGEYGHSADCANGGLMGG